MAWYIYILYFIIYSVVIGTSSENNNIMVQLDVEDVLCTVEPQNR